MTNESKLRAVIDKAVKNGWIMPSWYKGVIINSGHYAHENIILFSHDFAKAYWGEGKITEGARYEINRLYWWQYRLQQAVISDDPIDYYFNYI